MWFRMKNDEMVLLHWLCAKINLQERSFQKKILCNWFRINNTSALSMPGSILSNMTDEDTQLNHHSYECSAFNYGHFYCQRFLCSCNNCVCVCVCVCVFLTSIFYFYKISRLIQCVTFRFFLCNCFWNLLAIFEWNWKVNES